MNVLKTLGLISSLAVIAACESSDPTPLPDVGGDPVVAPAFIQVLHASSDAPPVNVLVDGAVAITNFDYKQGSGYIALDPAEYEIEVRATVPGGDTPVIGGTGNELFATLDSSRIYTIAALNDAASIEPLIIPQLSSNVGSGNVELTVLHAAPAVDAVDVYVTAVAADLSASAPVGTIAFKENIEPTEIPAGVYQIRITAEGDDTAVFDSGPVTLLQGARLFVAAVPNTTGGASPVSLAVLESTGSSEILDEDTLAGVRAVHNASDVPAVNVYADSGAVFSDLTFPQVSDIAEVPGGTYAVEVGLASEMYPAGIAIGPVNLDFVTGTTSTVVAHGTILNSDLGATQLTEDTRPVALYSKVRIFHGASTAPAVDIYLVPPGSTDLSGGPAISNLSYTESTGFVPVPAGTYDAIVTLAGTDTIAIGPAALPALVDGGVYNVIARDPMMGATEFGLTVYGE